MVKTKKKRRVFCYGQSMAEYAILIAIVSAALLSMQFYMRRGIQGVIKAAADEVGKQEDSSERVLEGPKNDSIYSTKQLKTERQREFIDGGRRSDIDTTESMSGVSESLQWQDK
jgi:hypothetical protein